MSEQATRGWAGRIGQHGASQRLLFFGESAVDAETLARAVVAAGDGLQEIGIEAGDLVAVLAPPSVEGVVLIHALLDQRIVLLPLNARLSEAEQAFILESSGARWLFVSEADAHARGLCERVGCGLLRFGAEDRFPDVRLEIEMMPGEALAAASDSRRAWMRENDAALVLYTSGTSGRPKGAVLSFGNLIASAQAQAELLGSHSTDRWLLCMPLFHVGGLSILTRSILAGSSVVLHERFDAERVNAALDRDGITNLTFVATMLTRLLEVRGSQPAPESLRFVLLGGGPAPQSLLERATALGYPLAPTYGLTESSSQVATRPPDQTSDSGGDLAAGLRPLPGVEVRVVDENREPVEVGITGGIEVRGPIVMVGYLDDPEATARTLRGGWLVTGDLGKLDASGGLRVLERRSDLILSGGENVYPAEIESVLVAHPNVIEAGVVGVADETFGQRPAAFVVWQGAASFDPETLESWCQERLARYKLPVAFTRVEFLPRTASGKLIRRQLSSTPRAPG